jgi:dephospho-CoA kinase
MMIIAGLTGSIGMGKSTVAGMFADLGAAVVDSDAIVHELYQEGGAAVAPIRHIVPRAIQNDTVDRRALAAHLRRYPDDLKAIEAAVHPLVRAAQLRHIGKAREQGAGLVILDIPLLFETGADRLVDTVLVASAPADVQRQRVMDRPGMTGELFDRLLSRQMSDAEKRRRADIIIDTSGEKAVTRQQVHRIYKQLLHQAVRT